MHDEPARKRDDGEDEPRPEGAEPSPDKQARQREHARNHPVRVAILALLSKYAKREGLTTSEVREHLPESEDRPLSAVAYHLRVLLGAKLVTATDTPGAASGSIERVWALP